ncbi:MAG TPA: peptidylprolyl isomerase [Candidatus Limnocylindrales bacterium]|nr:peptidylprolyl isomerase [Candidatus Limnocylindrales bacterium]
MSFRARPVSGRTRPTFGSDSPDRRNLFLNIGFGVVVVLSLLLLVLAWGLSWYNDHLAPAATVNGETITKDEFRARLEVDTFRLDLEGRRLRDRLQAGTIRETDYAQAQQIIEQQREQLVGVSLERMIDSVLQAQLAAEEGVTVSEADVDAKLTELATTPELRHAWIIEVEPELEPGASEPTDAQIAGARTKAERALRDIEGGRAWEDVAKEVSTHPTKDQGGDLGFILADAGADDPAFVDALFAAQLETPTEVIVGEDGVARIGRVTEIVDAAETPGFMALVQDSGVDPVAFRDSLRADALRDRLEEKVVADVTKPGPQRFVRQIFMATSDSEGKEGAIRTRHILYSPNDDPAGASAGDIPEDDPAWKTAEEEARATYERIKADPDLFDSIARAESDESSAVTSGGKLPYFAPGDAIDEAFAEAIFKGGYKPGQLLEPVKSSFGWHVIQVMHYAPDFEWAQQLQDQVNAGADFAAVARDNSDGPEAAEGGEIGWVARGQLKDLIEARIFDATIGEVGEPLAIPDEGVYLFLVEREETRAPEGEQLRQLQETAFDTWYGEKKLLANITRVGDGG